MRLQEKKRKTNGILTEEEIPNPRQLYHTLKFLMSQYLSTNRILPRIFHVRLVFSVTVLTYANDTWRETGLEFRDERGRDWAKYADMWEESV